MNLKRIIYQNSKTLNLFQLLGDFSFQPFFLLFHLTLDCNCSCQNCYQAFDKFYESKKGIVLPSEFEKILKDAKNSFLIKPIIHFFGGEPLLNPYFKEILRIAEKHNFKCSLTTNGTMLSRYLDDIIQSKKLNQINISLDDIGNKHDYLRSFPGAFERAISAIEKIRKIEKKSKHGKRKIININCVINSENYNRLVNIILYYSKNNIDIDMLAFQHQYSKKPVEFDIEILKDQMRKLKKIKTQFEVAMIPNIAIQLLDRIYICSSEKNSGKCPIPWVGLNILPNLEATPGGGVLECNHVVGNLKNQTMREIWNGKKMKEFRNHIRTKGVFPSCVKCCHCRLDLK